MLTVICPSRGRPDSAAEVVKTFKATAADLDTRLWFIVDPDDVTADAYPLDSEEPVVSSYQLVNQLERSGMLPPLNYAIGLSEIVTPTTTVVGFVGDDHRFRTEGWDVAIEDYLDEHPGIAYADDLLKRETLPTQWFVSRPIVDVFGMGLKGLQHLYIDDYWKALGTGAGCLYYMPQIVIEHMHPTVGKAEWDEGYRRVNAPSMYEADGATFNTWRATEYEADVARLRAILQAMTGVFV